MGGSKGKTKVGRRGRGKERRGKKEVEDLVEMEGRKKREEKKGKQNCLRKGR